MGATSRQYSHGETLSTREDALLSGYTLQKSHVIGSMSTVLNAYAILSNPFFP